MAAVGVAVEAIRAVPEYVRTGVADPVEGLYVELEADGTELFQRRSIQVGYGWWFQLDLPQPVWRGQQHLLL